MQFFLAKFGSKFDRFLRFLINQKLRQNFRINCWQTYTNVRPITFKNEYNLQKFVMNVLKWTFRTSWTIYDWRFSDNIIPTAEDWIKRKRFIPQEIYILNSTSETINCSFSFFLLHFVFGEGYLLTFQQMNSKVHIYLSAVIRAY